MTSEPEFENLDSFFLTKILSIIYLFIPNYRIICQISDTCDKASTCQEL